MSTEEENIRREVVAFYRRYNPDKLDNVDDIFAQWKGRTRLLLHALKDKYRVAHSEQNNRDEYRTKIESFYRLYNPSKLDDVESILNRWEGRERLLIQALEEKYQKPVHNDQPEQAPEKLSKLSLSPRILHRRQSSAYRRSKSTPPASDSPKKVSRRIDDSPLAVAKASRESNVTISLGSSSATGEPGIELLRGIISMQSAELRRLRSELNSAYVALKSQAQS